VRGQRSPAPMKLTEPCRARTTPEMARSSVDFPAPLAPISATMPACGTFRLTPRRARILPELPCRSRTSSSAPSLVAAKVGLDHPRIALHPIRRPLGDLLPEAQYRD